MTGLLGNIRILNHLAMLWFGTYTPPMSRNNCHHGGLLGELSLARQRLSEANAKIAELMASEEQKDRLIAELNDSGMLHPAHGDLVCKLSDIVDVCEQWVRRHPYLTGAFVGLSIGMLIGSVEAVLIWDAELKQHSNAYIAGHVSRWPAMMALSVGLLSRFFIPFYLGLRGRL